MNNKKATLECIKDIEKHIKKTMSKEKGVIAIIVQYIPTKKTFDVNVHFTDQPTK